MSRNNLNTLGALLPTTEIRILVVATIVSMFNPWTLSFASGNDHAGGVGRHQSEVLFRGYSGSSLRFEANQGQTEDRVQFLGRGAGYDLFFLSDEVVLRLRTAKTEQPVVRMRFIQASSEAKITGLEELEGKSNYFLGAGPDAWHTRIPAYRKIQYEGIYPGIDLVFYGNRGELEYDIVVHPGGRPEDVCIEFRGIDGLSWNENDELCLEVDGETLSQRVPSAYQPGPQAAAIETRVQLLGLNRIGFQALPYDPKRTLVIDPILKYSSYIGGDGIDTGGHVAVDSGGYVYLAGYADSLDFPIGPSSQFGKRIRDTIFVIKLTPDGKEIVYSAFLPPATALGGLAVDRVGRAHLVGTTWNSEFPLENPLQTSVKGDSDIFITRLSPNGDRLEFSSYLGGSAKDEGRGIDVTSTGISISVVGSTESDDFPTERPTQAVRAGGKDAFLVWIDPREPRISYATYWGGSSDDEAYGVAGLNCFTGRTQSEDFPLYWAAQSELKGSSDLFLAYLRPTDPPRFSTYLGGSASDGGSDVTLDYQGNAVVTGSTHSPDFPVRNAFYPLPHGGDGDVLVAKFNDVGVLQFSTFFGGTGLDRANAVVVDGDENIYVGGQTESVDFPVLTTIQPAIASEEPCSFGSVPCPDAFLAQLAPTGKLVHSTYLGGRGYDEIQDVAVTPWGEVYLAGSTTSTDFPTFDALQPIPGDMSNYGHDAFLAIISEGFQLHFAQFADGSEGNNSISSTLTLMNLTATTAANALVVLSDDQGNPLTVDLNGTEVSGHYQAVIPGGGGVSLQTDGEGPIQVGSVLVTSDVKLAGTVLYETPMGVAGFDASEPATKVSTAVQLTGDIEAGVALVSLDEDQIIQLQLKDLDGTLLSEASIDLDRGSHIAKMLTEFNWDPPVQLSDFSGLLVISGQARFAATSLRLSPEGWASLPVARMVE